MIRDHAYKFRDLLDDLGVAVGLHNQEKVEEQQSRFGLWISNFGVFSSTGRSLDYIFRNDPDVCGLIRGLIETLSARTESRGH
ncbi:hypothetical protein BCR34DRAFT_554396 [Clohesyomyces aquaticus]|uniref:Uncharacterized protein n=1 Tax=Clohesyomyces aquaticus TaxID=1231657 RepID=A0A1Y2A6S6_9PLEO|nr:hypothetical protein BCR34DRAFT_554396 [Clohesyomyces aquaticus]